MSDGNQRSQNYPPIAAEDLVKLGVESRFIPFIVSTTLFTEQSPNGSPPLSQAEVQDLVDTLDKVVSSTTANSNLKNRCFKILRDFSPANGILPKSYYPEGVILSEPMAYASGGYADIWKGQRDGNRVCVKAFRTETAANLSEIKRRFYREIIGWKYVSHQNVLPFYGVSETLFPFCIISSWLENGNIIDYTKENQRVNRLRLLAQAACGLEYLHSLSIVHSGINPANILVTDNGTACLGDFGITGVITDSTVVKPGSTATSKPGVVRYMAPELLNPSQFGLKNGNPSKESDVYSLAMTALEILSGVLPYGSGRETRIAFLIISGELPPRPNNTTAGLWLLDPIWNIFQHCWRQNPQSRPHIGLLHQAFVESEMEQKKDIAITSNGEAKIHIVSPAVSPPKPTQSYSDEPPSPKEKKPAQDPEPSTESPGELKNPPLRSPLLKRNPFKGALTMIRRLREHVSSHRR